MNITLKVKQFLIESCGLKADATDVEAKSALADAIMGGKMTTEKLAELTKADADESQLKIKSMIDTANAPILEALAKLNGSKSEGGSDLGTKAYNAGLGGSGEKPTETQVRVKSVVEQYSHTKSAATWDKSERKHAVKELGGQSVSKFMSGLQYGVDMPSDRDLAIIGATFKSHAVKAMGYDGLKYRMSEHEKQLLEYSAHECKYVGEIAGKEYNGEKLNEYHRKAVLDDSTSGGLEAVPIEFDSAMILQPLLNGELFPYVDLVNVSRRRIEAAIIENPVLTWGVGEGTAISLMDTDAFISAFDNNIYSVTGAIELGTDFLSDSPVSIGRIVVNNYGEAFRKELDTVIANGNGTSQPEGIFNKSGVSAITPAGGNGTAQQIGDYEALLFGVAKQYRDKTLKNRAVYLGTDETYSRARGIAVGASDERRIFGMNEEDYMILGHRFAVNEDAGNAKIAFALLNYYRMYRRQGMEITYVGNTDWQLARERKTGILVTGRFGGAMTLAAAMSKITAGQA